MSKSKSQKLKEWHFKALEAFAILALSESSASAMRTELFPREG